MDLMRDNEVLSQQLRSERLSLESRRDTDEHRVLELQRQLDNLKFSNDRDLSEKEREIAGKEVVFS